MNNTRINILTEHGTGDTFHRFVHVINSEQERTYITRNPRHLEVCNWGVPREEHPNWKK